MKVDRKTGERTTIYVPNAAVSITGTIQPATLRRALLPEYFENGLASRLLVVEPLTRAKRWTEHEIPDEVMGDVDETFKRLYALQPSLGVAGEHEPAMVDLTDDARDTFASFYDDWNDGLEEFEGAARWSASKLEAYAPRFALIRHCIRLATREKELEFVDGEDMAAGIDLARWFKVEVLRAYRLSNECEAERHLRQLRQWIADRGGRVTLRDLTHGPRRYRKDPGAAEADLRALVDAGHGAFEHIRPGAGGGKPKDVFCLADSPDFPIAKFGTGTVTHEIAEQFGGNGAGATQETPNKGGA